MSRWDSRTGSLLLVAGLFIVLGVLAVLQYRWTGELSNAERDRMRRAADESTRRLSAEFDGRLIALASRFRFESSGTGPLETRIMDAFARLAPDETRMISGLWILDWRSDQSSAQRLDMQSLQWLPADPPDYVRDLSHRGPIAMRGVRFHPFVPEGPAIVLPFGQPRFADEEGAGFGRGPGAGPASLVVLELDRGDLETGTFPELVRRYFGDDDVRSWSIRVVDPRSGGVIYASDEREPEREPDFRELLPGAGLAGSVAQLLERAGPGDPSRRGPGPGNTPGMSRGSRGEIPGPPPAGAWVLEVRHRDGTLQQTVDRSRARNLALSGAVLVLLLTGGLIIIANAHKSHELVRQQMEFVAAVTHELNTPIAAISSAGQNLADGVVQEPEQVSRYGKMIAKEGRRLSTMVEHVLEFAGMRSARYAIAKSPHPIGHVIDHALSATAWMVEENRISIEREISDPDQLVACDRDSLARALANLVSNAIKYRGDSNRIVVGTKMDSDRRSVEIFVRDEGLGLTAADRRRIFDPFVRGENAREGAIRGSGLGLSIVKEIVEAHGGRVSVDSTPGHGSVFSIRIPVS